MNDLSIIIPARNEEFLARTIEDILENIESDTDIIAILDGAWADPPLPMHERVNVVYVGEVVGQREAANIGARLSQAKYIMKVDAHCSFDKGFDRKMLESFKKVGDNVTMVPVMRNLWVFDWKCYHCGWKKYQGPKPEKCPDCGKDDRIKKKMVWIGKSNPQSVSYCFNSTPQFKYFNEYKKRPEYKEMKEKLGLTESMSIQGSCFMTTRKKYFELKLCDNELGNWGNQGIEVALKTWLSGGKVMISHNTWYAHLFRTQQGFRFPWDNRGREVARTKKNVKDLFWENKWDKQKYPVKWLVKKFSPVPGWTDEEIEKLDAQRSQKYK